MVVLQAANQKKVYVHKALLNDEVAAFGECGWSCFPSTTVKSFVEYLYQGDYTPPAAPVAIRKLLDQKNIFLAHARLFVLSRYREVLPLASMCLRRLNKAMKEAQDTTKESIFVKNMCGLIKFTYTPCCNGNDNVWKELQKTVSEFLISKKGWLEEPGPDLSNTEEQLAKDLFAAAINLLIITDQCLIDKDKIIADTNERLIDKDKILADTSNSCMQAQRKCEALKTEVAQLKKKAKKK
ncbi:hypothetical protein B9Z19DRAFT_1163090 [Tuber borchii]|uniref:BTB domain-containing protein n=1 Tax=Tuber borchii TaxID=42251 RepID=A0A2T6ZD57_TUBBO|nr:hypothetical protein B9Z19DRAFT_1163090 [Tuber borchii]